MCAREREARQAGAAGGLSRRPLKCWLKTATRSGSKVKSEETCRRSHALRHQSPRAPPTLPIMDTSDVSGRFERPTSSPSSSQQPPAASPNALYRHQRASSDPLSDSGTRASRHIDLSEHGPLVHDGSREPLWTQNPPSYAHTRSPDPPLPADVAEASDHPQALTHSPSSFNISPTVSDARFDLPVEPPEPYGPVLLASPTRASAGAAPVRTHLSVEAFYLPRSRVRLSDLPPDFFPGTSQSDWIP